MVDDNRRRLDVAVHKCAQRHLLAARRVQIDVAQCLRAVLKARIDLEHDVILIELGKDGRDDALTEGIVEHIVDR